MPEKPITNLNELINWINSLETRTKKNEDFGKKVYSGIIEINDLVKKQSAEIKKWRIITLIVSVFTLLNICLLTIVLFFSPNNPNGLISNISHIPNSSPVLVGKWVRTQATSYPTYTPEKSPIPSATRVHIILSWQGTPNMTPQIVPSEIPQPTKPPRECSLSSPEWFEFFTDGEFTTTYQLAMGNSGSYSIENGNRLKLVFNSMAMVYDVEVSGNDMILVSDKGCRTVYHK